MDLEYEVSLTVFWGTAFMRHNHSLKKSTLVTCAEWSETLTDKYQRLKYNNWGAGQGGADAPELSFMV